MKDSYTPQGLKLQILLVGAVVGLLVLALILPQAIYLALFALLSFLVTTVPFLLGLKNKPWSLKFASPVLLFLRAGALGAGLFWVIPRLMKQDPFADTAK